MTRDRSSHTFQLSPKSALESPLNRRHWKFSGVLQARQTVSRLQKLISFEGNFRNLRDTLHRCDPPCIPYLGMYLTELSFIEEGTPNFTEDGLLNFAKMRMVSIDNNVPPFCLTAKVLNTTYVGGANCI